MGGVGAELLPIFSHRKRKILQAKHVKSCAKSLKTSTKCAILKLKIEKLYIFACLLPNVVAFASLREGARNFCDFRLKTPSESNAKWRSRTG